MSQRTGLLGRIFRNFRNSFGAIKQTSQVVGSDHLGNKYFEKQKDEVRNLKGARWVETEDGDQWAIPDVSPEWRAWLQGRRKVPPSEKEIANNYALMMRTKHRAKDLEEKEKEQRLALMGDKQQEYTSSVDPNEDRNKSKFPTYPDFEINPGEKRK